MKYGPLAALTSLFIFICSLVYAGTVNRDGVDITVTTKGRLQRTEAVYIIKARPKKIWDVITDFDNHEKYMPNVLESTIVERNGRSLLVSKTMKVALQKITFTNIITIENKFRSFTWRLKNGPFKTNRGIWLLEPAGQDTRATYISELEPNFYIPSWIKKMLVEKSIPRMFKAIEKEISAR